MCSSFCVHLQYVAQFRSQGFFGLMKVLEYTFIVNCSRNHWVVLAFFDLKNTLYLVAFYFRYFVLHLYE